MAEQPPTYTPAPPRPTVVNMLVKFVHVDCWGPPRNRCLPHLEAINVDGTNFRQLEDSLEDAIHRRTEATHYRYTRIAENLRYKLFYRIKWAGHGESLSPDLEIMLAEDFRNQFRLVKERGGQDILIVSYRYCLDYAEPGSKQLRPRGTAQAVSGLNMLMHEEIDDSREDATMGQGGSLAQPDFSGIRNTAGQYTAMDSDRNDREVQVMVEDHDADIHDNSPSGLRSSGTDWRIPPARPATPAYVPAHPAPSPAALVIYNAAREIIAEIPLTSPSPTKNLHDKSPSEPPRAARPMTGDSTGVRRSAAHSITHPPPLIHMSSGAGDHGEDSDVPPLRSSKGKKPIYQGLESKFPQATRQSSPAINLRTANVDRNSSGGSSTEMHRPRRPSNNRLAQAGSEKMVFNRQVGSDTMSHLPARIVSGSERAGSPESSRRASLVDGMPPTFVVLP
ncbi:hypothetical protein F5Y10DRAFT_266032 [Nemania abortiva]|nr:hypothetical protein F5Y10DRAFT_266032 [Nemania abortiva]